MFLTEKELAEAKGRVGLFVEGKLAESVVAIRMRKDLRDLFAVGLHLDPLWAVPFRTATEKFDAFEQNLEQVRVAAKRRGKANRAASADRSRELAIRGGSQKKNRG